MYTARSTSQPFEGLGTDSSRTGLFELNKVEVF